MHPKKKIPNNRVYNFLLIVLVAVFVVSVYTLVLMHIFETNMLDNMEAENQERTDAMYSVVADLMTNEDFTEINDASDIGTRRYQILQNELNEIRSLNSTRYFYTAKRGADGKLIYLVDGLDQGVEDFRNPGDYIEDEMIPYIDAALDGENVYSKDIVDTTWGHIFTACYPVRDDASGEVVGALCIEMDMERTYQFIAEREKLFHEAALVAIIVVIILTCCGCVFVQNYRKKERERQEFLEENNQKLEELLENETKKSEIIAALGSLYSTIFVADVVTHEYELIESVELMHGITGTKGRTDDVIDYIVKAFAAPDMQDELREFLNFDTLAERLADKMSVIMEYRDHDNQWKIARFIVKRRDEQGNVNKVLYVARNINDEKLQEFEMQDQLRRSMEIETRANKAKTEFLRRMSHDIRTPLNGIIGMIHIEEKNRDNVEKLEECRKKMLNSADYLLALINNVLDISKMESGSITRDDQPFDLVPLLMSQLSLVETNAAEHDLIFEGGKDSSDIRHRYLIGSSMLLNRVLMNLASNAIKYNQPGGKIKLYCRELTSDADTATFEFVCIDTGLGMSEEFQKHAFDPFTQEGKETITTFSGSGLGLSIVKEIVEMMDGTIKLESEENVGTTFTVVIPFAIDHEELSRETEEKKQELTNVKGRKVLLVEDNEINMEIAKLMLEEEGLIITEAQNGKEAVAAFANSEEGFYDYIFMDVMMPVMDGLEATRKIRALDRADAKTVKIIAMTANAFEEDKKACIEAGMNAHLGKPIISDALGQVL